MKPTTAAEIHMHLEALVAALVAQEGYRVLEDHEFCAEGDFLRTQGSNVATMAPAIYGERADLACKIAALCCGGRPEAYCVVRRRDASDDN